MLMSSSSELSPEEALPALPPLPRPDYGGRCRESTTGTTLVLVLTGVFVGVTCVSPRAASAEVAWTLIILIVVQAAIALVCLAGLLFGDPGVVKRSPETCLPVPSDVAARLARGESMGGSPNLVDSGRSYCVRCFAWRPSTRPPPHHCSTCQRCVVYFDHHCGVFGRCIAGKGFGGNMGYFRVIIGMCITGFITTMAAVVIGINTTQWESAPSLP